jgi:hypothetical protein
LQGAAAAEALFHDSRFAAEEEPGATTVGGAIFWEILTFQFAGASCDFPGKSYIPFPTCEKSL